MRWIVPLSLLSLVSVAHAQPAGWDDAPAMIAAAVAPVEADLRACLTSPGPRVVGLIIRREPHGRTFAMMPMPPVGIRGFTAEEKCLMRTVAQIAPPPLPLPFERITFAYTIGATAPPPADPAFAAWLAPAATVTAAIDPVRTALAACVRRPRIVHLVFDRRRDKTRAWLPAWQFHAHDGSGSTPARQRKVKACLTRVVRRLAPPLLPQTMGDLQIAFDVPESAP